MTILIIYSIIYIGLFSLTEWLYHQQKITVEHTRKMVHVATGFIALSFPIFITALWQMLVLCGSFLLLMSLCEKTNWLKSITSVKRKSYGSWLFALIVFVCYFIQQQLGSPLYFYLPILILSICDPVAAIIGKRFNYQARSVFGQTKTIGGSIAFFVSSLIILCGFYFQYQNALLYLPLFALSVTLLEFFSTKGWDNLTIPLGVVANIFIVSNIITII